MFQEDNLAQKRKSLRMPSSRCSWIDSGEKTGVYIDIVDIQAHPNEGVDHTISGKMEDYAGDVDAIALVLRIAISFRRSRDLGIR